MRVIDLKDEPDFLEQYVKLRNSYCDLLLTNPVSVDQTKQWLKDNNILIRGLVREKTFLGAVVLYLHRENEVAFFVMERNKGLGTKLLEIIEQVAEKEKLNSLWAWVLINNPVAQRVFEKRGFVRVKSSSRQYKGKILSGIVYTKDLCFMPVNENRIC